MFPAKCVYFLYFVVLRYRDWKSQLAALQRQIITQESTVFNVTRCDVLNGFRRGVNRKCFDPFKRIDVLFVDSANVAEGSIDSGGPTREFLRLLLLEIFTSGLFEGPANGKQLALSTIGIYALVTFVVYIDDEQCKSVP